MKATRFSMTLYISLPILASACSIVMISHFVMLVEGRIAAEGLYGDTIDYIALAESLHFFGSNIISFRVVGPLISGLLAGLFSLSGNESVGLLTGSLNFIYLLIGFGLMYYLSIKEDSVNSFEVALPTFLILPLPAFWQGAFLPVPDALMFCTFAIILTAVLLRKLAVLLPAMVIGVWVSEWLLLSALILPIADILRYRLWKEGYIAFAIAFAGYLAVPLITQIPDAHLLYRTTDWFAGLTERFANREYSLLHAFWRSFTLTLPFFAYRIYAVGWNRITSSLSLWFGLVFVVAYLVTPDTAHRIVFLFMPALVLWQYQPPTFQTMNKSLNRKAESAAGG